MDDTDADQYTVGDADITKGSSKIFFKVITTRYFKSAYPVLVEEVKYSLIPVDSSLTPLAFTTECGYFIK